MNKPNILVILGSIRNGRNGKKVADWFMNVAQNFPFANLSLADLKDHPLPMFDDATPPSQRELLQHDNPAVKSWLEKVHQADGYVIITPEYNHSVPAVLKNALDFPFKEWHNKPVGFVSYGGLAGGVRAVEHLRGIVGELHMHDVREQVIIPAIWSAFDQEGNLAHHDSLAKTALAMLEQITTFALQFQTPVPALEKELTV